MSHESSRLDTNQNSLRPNASKLGKARFWFVSIRADSWLHFFVSHPCFGEAPPAMLSRMLVSACTFFIR
jgi:hypothetical protein